jgi:putative glycosyltransferase (TIGR04348 family)
MRVAIVTPAAASSRTGNRHTAARYGAFLRSARHDVRIQTQWDGRPADLMIALHARRSHAAIAAYRAAYPERALILVLTGTDVYRDIRTDTTARQSLALADRLIVLQARALDELNAAERAKAHVVFQSAATRLRHAPRKRTFRIAVLGHLRDEKDSFRAAHALARVPGDRIEVLQVGDALTPADAHLARQWMKREPRYRWMGGRAHGAALRYLASSHVLVLSSKMEGGANVICEAARIGVPVIASRISGNVGMLGEAYPAYYPLGDERALAALIERARDDASFYRAMTAAIRERRPLFAPAAERRGLLEVVRLADADAGKRRE